MPGKVFGTDFRSGLKTILTRLFGAPTTWDGKMGNRVRGQGNMRRRRA